MKFLAFVDTHASKKRYEELKQKVKKESPDFLICAGDFTVFGSETEKYLKTLSKLHPQLFLIHGNHEDWARVKVLCKELGITYLHKDAIPFKDCLLIGWGGGGFSQRDTELEDWTKIVKKDMLKAKKEGKKLIVVAHAPFYKTKLDTLFEDHLGNKSLRQLIKEIKADIGVCGHFHENQGKEDTIGNCRVYNPGPSGKIILV